MERLRDSVVARRAALGLLLAGASLLVAACGAGVVSPGVASIGTTTTTTSGSTPDSGDSGSNYGAELAYSRCMRKNGVPNFPDPSATGGFEVSGVNPRSPVLQAAQKTCAKFLPGPSPGTSTNPSPAAMASMLKVAQCMRAHGIANFPDPTTTVPSVPPSGGGVISDRDGVILVLPSSLDMQSSLFRHAAAACNFPLTNH